MSAPKFSPGPWTIGSPNCRLDGVRERGVHAGDYVIADLNADAGPEAQQAADARLIAAAPELYAALRVMVDKAVRQNWNDNYPEQLAQARAALAKAVQP